MSQRHMENPFKNLEKFQTKHVITMSYLFVYYSRLVRIAMRVVVEESRNISAKLFL